MLKNRIACGECGGDAYLTNKTIKLPIGESLLMIQDVPCYVCKQCGDTSFDSSVFRVVEKIVAAHKQIKMNTKVDYQIA